LCLLIGISSFLVKKGTDVLTKRPWKMYPLGVLFGLGFDTSSEIALLGISSVEASRQSNFWVILIFPILFTGNIPPWSVFSFEIVLTDYRFSRNVPH
jgi:high-affinity nickel permease